MTRLYPKRNKKQLSNALMKNHLTHSPQKYLLSVSFLICCTLLSQSIYAQVAQAGDFIESAPRTDVPEKTRKLQYYPDQGDFVCINGKNRYTRALYGNHSPFRVETSDRPVFAFYHNGRGGNISFKVILPDGKELPLDCTEYCESRYSAGKRTYHLTDPSWGKGELHITVLALTDADGAIWRFSATDMPAKAILRWQHGGATGKRLSRNGDMGVDPIDCFELPADATDLVTGDIPLQKEAYLVRGNLSKKENARRLYEKAAAASSALASQVQIETPDPYLNTLGGALTAAADGIWDGQVWLHGAIGWRMPLSGWRAAYTGDALGWHDRARTHFDAYAASQVTEVPNTLPHPAQDSVLSMARSVKKWGTPQYSNGYICRNPQRNDQMHHYDMNLCYIDELLWHFNWTGDIAYVRQMWPVLTRHLAWEKLNFDPDNDGLYDAYACIWASDALYYNSGAVTHSSAYNYRSHKMAAFLASLIGEDPVPYQQEAGQILKAMNQRLWMQSKGCWAEYQDFMGHRRLHESPGLWTIYHALDSEVADPFQAYQATRYVDTHIPHLPVCVEGLEEGYATLATTNWLPYSWSINNVAFAEVMHTALAYFQASRPEEAYRLMKSSILDGMYLGNSPGNWGQVSFYDAARGECYRDFGDPVGVASRLLVQGLYGILPDALNGKLVIRPGFPSEWEKASIALPDLTYRFVREKDTDTYQIEQRFETPLALTLQINAGRETIHSVKVNGKSVSWSFAKAASGYPVLVIPASSAKKSIVEITWGGKSLSPVRPEIQAEAFTEIDIPATAGAVFGEVYDPQGVLVQPKVGNTSIRSKVNSQEGHHTFFVRIKQGQMEWWQPVNVEITKSATSPTALPFSQVNAPACRMIQMDALFNANVSDIFRNEYLTPRSPYTTLQLPVQGIGEWCHPKLTADIDDTGLRALVRDEALTTQLGVSFRTLARGNNIAFTSLWDNYPDSLSIPLTGRASHGYLMMAGSTNHMQCRIANGIIRVYYTDGTFDLLELVNPDNWCPIEQDFYVDGQAFAVSSPRPYRIHFKTGLVSNDLGKDLGIKGVYGRPIEGGAGILLDMPLNSSKELSHLTLETLSNDVVIGLMGITLQ